MSKKIYESDACWLTDDGEFCIHSKADIFDFDWLLSEVKSAERALEQEPKNASNKDA